MPGDTISWGMMRPELTTRGNLLDYLTADGKFRKKLFRWLQYMDQAVGTRDLKAAGRNLALTYAFVRESLKKEETNLSHAVYNECVGVLRNREKNIRRRKFGHKITEDSQRPSNVVLMRKPERALQCEIGMCMMEFMHAEVEGQYVLVARCIACDRWSEAFGTLSPQVAEEFPTIDFDKLPHKFQAKIRRFVQKL